MIELGDGGCAQVRAAAVLVWVTLLASVAPALAQGELVGGYVVSIAGMARFNGGIESKTFKCATRGSCVASVRVEVHGEAYDYFRVRKGDRYDGHHRLFGSRPRCARADHRIGR